MVAPNQTILFPAVVLKPVPIIVTVVPTAPVVGEKEDIVGGGRIAIPIFIK